MTALHHIAGRTRKLPPLRVGIGGPVGSGKTTLVEMLCKTMRERWTVVITNDIYTKEDQRLLTVAARGARTHHGVEMAAARTPPSRGRRSTRGVDRMPRSSPTPTSRS